MRPSNSYGWIVARSIWRPLAVVPLDAAIGETLPASLKVPAELGRQEGGSTALRLMLARFSILVIRVAQQVRASRPDAGPRAVSHPLITSGSVMDSAAADAAVAVAWAWARSEALNRMSARRDGTSRPSPRSADPIAYPTLRDAVLARALCASAGHVFACGGDRFGGEAFEYIRLVAGQDEGADAVLEGHLG